MRTVIHWFRRDLRISDNTALSEAARRAETVVPVFILDDSILSLPDMGAARVTFLLRSLDSLAKNLEALGHRLIIRRGRPEEEIIRLCREAKADAVFWNKDYEPYNYSRDERMTNLLHQAGVGAEGFKDAVIWEEEEILTQAEKPFTVFTPYSKAWKARAIPAPRPRFKPTAPNKVEIMSYPLPTESAELGYPLKQTIFPAGEHAALEALKVFMEKNIFSYDTQRGFPALDASSHLSPHLHFGTINVRTILAKLNQARASVPLAHQKGCEIFLNELIWREFYIQILANFPHVATGNFRREYDALKWQGTTQQFKAWCDGMTGYPIVDAAMRCLNATGWMHNRLRMIVAMFLTKDLLIHWQQGERYFMQQLVDGNLAANNGGWQWSAGTGTDAAPYFRIFNPVSQGQKFDAAGAFVRRWVPELASVPDEFIHCPWENPLLFARLKYPERIVLHDKQRPKCLAMFKAVKGSGMQPLEV